MPPGNNRYDSRPIFLPQLARATYFFAKRITCFGGSPIRTLDRSSVLPLRSICGRCEIYTMSVVQNVEGYRAPGSVQVDPIPSSSRGSGDVPVPRFSEYRSAVAPNTGSIPVAAGKPAQHSPGRVLVALVMLTFTCGAIYGLWNAFFRYSAYGIVDGHLVEVVPPWSGDVRHVHVRSGERVTPGQLLVTMVNPELQQQLVRLEDELRIARATLSAESARLEWLRDADTDERQEATADYYEAWGNLLNERAQLKLAVTELARARELAEKKAISVQDVERATYIEAGQRDKVGQLEHAVAQLRQRAEAAPPSSDRTKSQLEPHLLRIETLQSEISRCQEDLERGRIRASVSGTVIQRDYLPGDHVDEHQPVLQLLEEGSTEIVLYLPQSAAAEMRVGQHLQVVVPPAPEPVLCKVDRIGQRYQEVPKPIETHYRSNRLLLPIYLRPTGPSANDVTLRLGGIALAPRTAWPSVTVDAGKE